MPFSFIHHPDNKDNWSEKKAKEEFERWRTLREAGIRCKFSAETHN